MRPTLIALLLGAALALTACGDDDESGAAPAATADATAAFPVTIKSQFGTTEIPAQPERVVTSGNADTDIALQLGIFPVAQSEYAGFPDGVPPWREPLLDGREIPLIKYNPDGYDVEETLSYEPDLVLNSFLTETDWNGLHEAVPTVSPDYETDPSDYVRMLGKALGRSAQAEELVQETEAKIAAVADEHPETKGVEIAIGYVGEPGKITNFTDPGTMGLLRKIGFAPHPPLDNSDYETFNMEAMTRFDASGLLVVSYQTEELQRDTESDPLFKRLKAVQEGRYWGSTEGSAFDNMRSVSPAEISYALDGIITELIDLIPAS
jgi:iron complex transport system substrate-binding protein